MYGESYVDEDLEIGSTYKYSIKAFNEDGNSSLMSPEISIELVDNIAPTKPENLVLIEKTENSIKFSWEDSQDNISIDSYNVYLDNVLVNTVEETITEYEILDLTENTDYQIYVEAFDSSGNVSEQSDVLSVITNLQKTTNIRTTIIGDIFVNLEWDAVENADYYEVYRDDLLIASVEVNNYLDVGLTKLTSYSYAIKAINNDGNYSLSDLYVVDTSDRYVISTSMTLTSDLMLGNVL